MTKLKVRVYGFLVGVALYLAFVWTVYGALATGHSGSANRDVAAAFSLLAWIVGAFFAGLSVEFYNDFLAPDEGKL